IDHARTIRITNWGVSVSVLGASKSALIDATYHRFDIHDRRAVERLEVAHAHARAIERDHDHAMEADRIGPIRRAGVEYALLRPRRITARPHAKHLAARPIEPGQHEQVIARANAVECRQHPRREHDRRLRAALVALPRRERTVLQWRFDAANRYEL